MANFQAYNDKVWLSPPVTFVANGVSSTTPPAGSNPVATSALPNSLATAFVASGGTYHVSMTPKVMQSLGISYTVSGAGIASATYLVDVVPDPNAPPAVVVDQTQANWTTTVQNVPTSPGP